MMSGRRMRLRRTRARALGFDAVMLMAKRPHLSVLDYDAEARGRLRRQLDRLGLRVACLAGYTDLSLGAERPDIPAREMQILYVRELCRLAQDLDNVGPSWPCTRRPRRTHRAHLCCTR